MTEEEAGVSIVDAAERLKCTRQGIHEKIRAGRLEVMEKGRPGRGTGTRLTSSSVEQELSRMIAEVQDRQKELLGQT